MADQGNVSTPCKNCIFCNVIEENDPSKIIHQDCDLVVFSDIRPAAKCHFLIVSREHIKDAKALTKDNKLLVEHMTSTAKVMLHENSENPSDSRLGFHWPPFHSVPHLHLHAISPTADMSLINRLIFKSNSWWFVSPEYVLKMLS